MPRRWFSPEFGVVGASSDIPGLMRPYASIDVGFSLGGDGVQSRFGFYVRRGYFRPVRRWRLGSGRGLGHGAAMLVGLAIVAWVGITFSGAANLSRFSPSAVLWGTAGQIAREGARLGPAMGGWLSMDPERGKAIIQQTMPTPVEATLEMPPQISWQNRLRFWLYMALDYDITQPQTLLEAVLPHPAPAHTIVQLPDDTGRRHPDEPSADAPSSTQTAPGNSAAPKPGAKSYYEEALAPVRHANTKELARLQQVDWGDKPLVLIFHTHSSEMYKPANLPPGAKAEPHQYNTTDTGIIRAGETLARTLSERYGIPVVHSKAIHDFPSFAHAYTNAAKTVRSLLAKYPSIQVVIDVHRDAAEDVSFVREINGVPAAQVMVVVSKLGETKPSLHPRWRENMQFATKMEEIMRELYPNMLRHYPPVTARYNQQLHPNMVLLEIGNYIDAEVYALRSAAMMADVVAMMVDMARRNPVRSASTLPEPAQSASTGSAAARPTTNAKPATPALKPPQPQERPGSGSSQRQRPTPPSASRPAPSRARP